jgi:predicted dehydrogenase
MAADETNGNGAAPVRIGMIGIGGIARHHVGQLSQIPGVQITAIADPSAEQIAQTVEKFPALKDAYTTSDYRALLARDDVDAVEIATPHTQHFEQAVAAIDANKHVLLEKPMVCAVTDAHALLKRLDGYSKVFALAYQRHAMGQFALMQQKISSGELGEVQFISALQCQQWKKGTVGKWRQVPELSGGGQLNDSGSHLLDILLWVTGLTVSDVSAFIDNCGTPVDINSAISMTFTNCAQGNISIIGDAPTWHEDISIWCEKGSFFYRNGKLEFVNEKGTRTTLDGDNLPPTHNIDQDFIRAVRGEKQPAAPPICGLRTIELTEAAWKSAAQGGAPVRMNPPGKTA